MRKRNHIVPLHLNKKELAHLEAQVKTSGLPREEFLRSLIMGAELRARPCDHHADLLHKVAGLCNNANQLARVANTYISYAVREDIRKLDRRIEQAEFIFKNHIADRGQLAAIRQKAEDEIAALIKQRQKLYRYEPKSPQIGVCTAQLKKLRHTVKLCRNIEIHSIEMEQRLQSAQLEEHHRREQQKKEDPQKEARNRDNQKGR